MVLIYKMIVTIIFLIFLASFILYSTSKQNKLIKVIPLQSWIENNTKFSKIIALAVLIITLALCTFYFGFTSGIIFWLLCLCLFFSLIIIITPTHTINYKSVIIMYCIFLILEISLNYASK